MLCRKIRHFVNVGKHACDSVSVLVWFNNFALNTSFYWSYKLLLMQVAHSYEP